MYRSAPLTTMYILTIAITVLGFLVIMNIGGLIQIPILVFQIYAVVFALFFFWWPIDMLINWDKRTDTANTKDRLVVCVLLSVVLFLFPHYFFDTPFYTTLVAAIGIGFILPGLIAVISKIKFQQPVISPGLVHKTGMATKKAELFNNRFPRARQYILGYSGGSNRQAKLVLHERIPYERYDAQIDYVLSVSVDRKTGICIEGLEKLECYLFINEEGKAGVAFLPTANYGRALDYGFSDDEIDGAIAEAKKFEQTWPAIDFEPLPVVLFSGQYVRMK